MSGEVPNTRASLSAVSGVTDRFPRTTSFRRGNETPSRTAKADWLIPSGLRNSSSSIAPGWVGTRALGNHSEAALVPTPWRLVVVGDFDFLCTMVLPTKTNAVLLVDPNAVLPGTISLQQFKSIARRNRQIGQPTSTVELIELAVHGRPQLPWAGRAGRSGVQTVEEVLRTSIGKRTDHITAPVITKPLTNETRKADTGVGPWQWAMVFADTMELAHAQSVRLDRMSGCRTSLKLL